MLTFKAKTARLLMKGNSGIDKKLDESLHPGVAFLYPLKTSEEL